ncbi:MAG: YchJ family protein [Bacteriovoracaceae bacterium]
MKNQICPCGSTQNYDSCCEPYIKGKAAPTAEALMRSRYSAYVNSQIDYIEKTHSHTPNDEFDKAAALEWSKNSTWLGLEIKNTKLGKENDSKGTVEFIARYKANNNEKVFFHQEISEFEKIDGKWFYKVGTIVGMEPIRRTAEEKIGRNDPCHCGSGKKFKKCCGA